MMMTSRASNPILSYTQRGLLPGLSREGRVGAGGVPKAGLLSSSLQGRIHGVPRQTPPGPGNRKTRVC